MRINKDQSEKLVKIFIKKKESTIWQMKWMTKQRRIGIMFEKLSQKISFLTLQQNFYKMKMKSLWSSLIIIKIKICSKAICSKTVEEHIDKF